MDLVPLSGSARGGMNYLGIAALTKSQSQVQVLELGKEQLKMCCPAPGNFGLSQRSQTVCFLSVYDSGIYKIRQSIS